MLCSPDLTLRHSKLVEEERPQQRHGFLPLLAIPERPHVRFALPQRDRVACVWVALVSRQPLALEPLHISPQGCCLLVGSFKPVPLAGSDSSPNDTHVHVRLLPCVLPVSQTHRPSHSAAQKAHWLAFQSGISEQHSASPYRLSGASNVAAIFGGNNARLYGIHPEGTMLDLKGDRFAIMKRVRTRSPRTT